MGTKPLTTRSHTLPLGSAALFAAIAAAILLGGYSLYRTEEQQLRTTREKELSAIARLKAERIWEWREKVTADAHVIIDSPFFQESLAQWMTSGDTGIAQRALNRFRAFQEYYGYQDVLLVGVDGGVRLSLSDARTALASETLKCLDKAVKSHAPILTDLYRPSEDAFPLLDVIAPLFSSAEESEPAFGAVILRVDPGKVLFPLIQTWPTVSETAETLLVRREGEYVLYLSELRHRKDTALRLKIPLSEVEVPAVQAVMGLEGTFMGMDYRGVEVLSAVEPIRDSAWFIVSKVDAEEAFSEWQSRRRAILALTLVLLLGAFGGFAFFWQRQKSQHYQALYGAEQERMALLRHFEYLVRYANDIILLANQDAHIIEANDRAVSAYGYTPEEMRDLSMVDLVAPEERDHHHENLRESREEGAALYETIHRRKDGTRFNVEVSTRFIEIEGVPYLQKIIRDITERRLAEQAREELLKSLQEKTEEMESLLYVSSHDLRTPLVNIQGFSQRLEKAANELSRLFELETDRAALQAAAWPILREKVPAALGYIVASANKMDSLISGLLRISRLGRMPLNAVEVDMNTLLGSVLASQEYQIRRAGAVVSTETLPNCWGDPSQINQVFSNLIDNALKYGNGQKPLAIRIRGEIQGDMAAYCVEDSGSGIKPEHQDKVWGLFSRLDPFGEVEGEGLGLTVVKRIVQRHRGRVWLKSDQDKGCSFFVALPRHAAPNDNSHRDYMGKMGES